MIKVCFLDVLCWFFRSINRAQQIATADAKFCGLTFVTCVPPNTPSLAQLIEHDHVLFKSEYIMADKAKYLFKSHNNKYLLAEKKKLAELCEEYRVTHLEECKSAPKQRDTKRKRVVQGVPTSGFLSRAVRNFFSIPC